MIGVKARRGAWMGKCGRGRGEQVQKTLVLWSNYLGLYVSADSSTSTSLSARHFSVFVSAFLALWI